MSGLYLDDEDLGSPRSEQAGAVVLVAATRWREAVRQAGLSHTEMEPE